MPWPLLLGALLLGGQGCLETEVGAPSAAGAVTAASVAQGLVTRSTLDPLDYSDLDLWPCSSATSDDICDRVYTADVPATDGSVATVTLRPAADPPLDCFYIYPTLDFSLRAENDLDLDEVELPLRTIIAQAAPFGEVCRVFAPLYRQASFFTYGADLDEAVPIFRNAFADVAAAFEHYLQTWNNGRPLVILGHSQGAQHATYLLHSYFDGDRVATAVSGSTTTAELRRRLVVALPIGFRLFAEAGEVVGGSLTDIPACTRADETGCAIHFRSYSEGDRFNGLDRVIDFGVDRELAREGLLNRGAEAGRDELICVNPATQPVADPAAHMDIEGQPLAGEVFELASAQFLGAIGDVAGFDDAERRHLNNFYTATCRHDKNAQNYLAIGLPGTAANDLREDVIDIDSQLTTGRVGSLGLHLWDFSLAMGDLIAQVRHRGQVWLEAR